MKKPVAKNTKCILFSIIIWTSLLGVMGTIVIFFVDVPNAAVEAMSFWLGTVGTLSSVILSIMSMMYANKSSKDAEKSLMEIREHYATLCNTLANQEIQKALGSKGVENIIDNFSKLK